MKRAEMVEELREDVAAQLEEMLDIKTEEVSIIQEQLAVLCKNYVKGAKMKDPYGDSGTYTGQVKGGTAHGKGTMNYDDGRVYKGDWNEGKWHGRGKATFTNGDSYEGEYRFDQRHGVGIYRWRDGRVFAGPFVSDTREGEDGEYTWPDGAR